MQGVEHVAQCELDPSLARRECQRLGLLGSDQHRDYRHRLRLAVLVLLDRLAGRECLDILHDDPGGRLFGPLRVVHGEQDVHPGGGGDEAGNPYDLVHCHADGAHSLVDDDRKPATHPFGGELGIENRLVLLYGGDEPPADGFGRAPDEAGRERAAVPLDRLYVPLPQHGAQGHRVRCHNYLRVLRGRRHQRRGLLADVLHRQVGGGSAREHGERQ